MLQLHIDLEDLQDIFEQNHFQSNKNIDGGNRCTLFFHFAQV